MKRIYPVSVKLLSAMHINGGTDINNNRITVKAEDKAYIPATLFKGMVRENFTKLWRLADTEDIVCSGKQTEAAQCGCTVCRMFGKAGFQRSRIFFDHLETVQTPNYRMRSNVSIDRHTHKIVETALVFTEVVAPLAADQTGALQPCIFQGEITVYYPPEFPAEKQKKIEAVLVQSVRMITNIGLGKSRGLGFTETEMDAPEGGWLCEKR